MSSVNFGHAIDQLGLAVERGMAPEHHRDVFTQFCEEGKTGKMASLVRCVPATWLEKLVAQMTKDTTPIQGDLIPYSYGSESVVYRVGSMVVKLHNPRVPAKECITAMQSDQELYLKCFEELVTPQHFFTYESRHRTGRAQVGMVQEYIDGVDLFECLERAKQSDLHTLLNGTQRIYDETSGLPDFAGKRNCLLDNEGRVHLIDHTVQFALTERRVLPIMALEEQLQGNSLQTAVN